MGSKTRLNTYCTKRRENPANLAMSRNINTKLARPSVVAVDNVKLGERRNACVLSVNAD